MSSNQVIDILLVEDNDHDAAFMVRAMKKRNIANRMFRLEDGEQALDFVFGRGAYSTHSMDKLKVILLDLKLPKVNGLEVLRELKQDVRTRHLPVVIITSSDQDPDIQTAYELGANSYVVKPVQPDAFLDVMSQLGFYWLLINKTRA